MLLIFAQTIQSAADAAPVVVAVPLYSPLMITLISGLIVTVIGATVSGIVAVITALRVTAVKEVQNLITPAILDVAKNTETIKGHVNSERTAAEGRELALRRENELLREMLADKKVTAQLLAQAVATAASAAAGASATTATTAPIVVAVPIPAERREQNQRAGDAEPVKVEVINDPLLTRAAVT
jgi:hypothetical protein